MLKAKKCKICGSEFIPKNSLHVTCQPACAVAYVKKKKLDKIHKAERKELRERKEALRPLSFFVKKAQKAFNAYIRERDKNEPCISCGVMNPPALHGGQWDCGHFLTVGAHPELRFDERNAYKQCKKCNGGSGRFTRKNHTVSQQYEENLRAKVGDELVDWLQGPHNAKHYTREELLEIEKLYKKKLKELQSD